MKTIKDLAAGRVIAEHDGNLADLITLLSLAWPNSPYTPTGNSRYYGKDRLKKGTTWAGFNELVGSKPVQKVSDFLKPSEPWAPRQGEQVWGRLGHAHGILGTYISFYKSKHLIETFEGSILDCEEVKQLPKTEVSLAEVAEWKKLEVHQIKIVP